MHTPDPWGDDREAARAAHQDEQAARLLAQAAGPARLHCGYSAAHAPHPTPHGPCPGTPLPPLPESWYPPQAQPLPADALPRHAREYVPTPRHWLHLLLLIVTGGAWLVPGGVIYVRWLYRLRRAERKADRG